MHVEHGRSYGNRFAIMAVVVIIMGAMASPAIPQMTTPTGIDNPLGIPDARNLLPAAQDAKGVTSTLQILVLLTVLTLVPSIVILTTCFTRMIIVLALLRQAMGTAQLPPSQVIMGLALFLTFLVMGPTFQRINNEALRPYLDNELSQEDALNRAVQPLREFMFRQIEASDNYEDVYMCLEYRRGEAIPADEVVTQDDIDTTVLVPAFILSELKTAFIMGFRFYLPFLVIDMVIASVLISMGMMMLPPVLISLPFKILLFVLADGWHLVVQTLLYSFS